MTEKGEDPCESQEQPQGLDHGQPFPSEQKMGAYGHEEGAQVNEDDGP